MASSFGVRPSPLVVETMTQMTPRPKKKKTRPIPTARQMGVYFMHRFTVDHITGCWNWNAGKVQGYGRVRLGGRADKAEQWLAHHVTYYFYVGPIPEGLEIDHLCNNRACVNPHHLEAVTHRENLLRSSGFSAVKAKQTHCIHGHEFTPENTYRAKNGTRSCRMCHRLSERRRKERARQVA